MGTALSALAHISSPRRPAPVGVSAQGLQ